MTLIHILRGPSTVNWDVEGILASLDKHELRFVGTRCCGFCEQPLDRAGCSAIQWGDDLDMTCPQWVRVRRLENLLATYKPRMNRRKHG